MDAPHALALILIAVLAVTVLLPWPLAVWRHRINHARRIRRSQGRG